MALRTGHVGVERLRVNGWRGDVDEALARRSRTAASANRLDLDVFLDNDRTRRAYEKAGFREEGVLREWHPMPDGSFADVRLMSILRRELKAA